MDDLNEDAVREVVERLTRSLEDALDVTCVRTSDLRALLAERGRLAAERSALLKDRDGWKDEAVARGRRINELEKRR